jgi:hypothetical protein
LGEGVGEEEEGAMLEGREGFELGEFGEEFPEPERYW